MILSGSIESDNHNGAIEKSESGSNKVIKNFFACMTS